MLHIRLGSRFLFIHTYDIQRLIDFIPIPWMALPYPSRMPLIGQPSIVPLSFLFHPGEEKNHHQRRRNPLDHLLPSWVFPGAFRTI